ncbi:MAG: hypothetical protein EHM64_14285 [Ignavibacteriae bacterium]|nr:MAG: hypothetical protein EHM64_14285 [Ignavibacteriota bacterium]
MKCPSCNQLASTLIRNSFSLQGVTFYQSVKGQLKCQNCGVLLRNAKFGKQVWLGLAAFVVMMVLMMLFSDPLRKSLGMGAVLIYWIVLLLMAVFVFAYGQWKYAMLEIVDKIKET